MTEFRVEAVRVGALRKHENADSLSITDVHGGYPCIIRTGDLAEGDLAVYVPVDALVPVTTPTFAFLDSGKGRAYERIKARKLRGVFSMGLLVKAPDGVTEGDDCRQLLGIEKWEPESEKEPMAHFQPNRKRRSFEMSGFERCSWLACGVGLTTALILAHATEHGSVAAALAVASAVGRYAAARWYRARNTVPNYPTYDIEGVRKFSRIVEDGEEVSITEKIHGCNASFLHTGKRFWAKSRTMFRSDPGNVWAVAAERYGLEQKLAAHPGVVLFGEVYGEVQDLKYGVPATERVRLACFDAMRLGTREFMGVDEFRAFCQSIDVPVVPELYRGPWERELLDMAEGKSTMPGANHVREGIVIKPVVDRRDNRLGRVILKLAGQGYLLRKDAA